MKAPRIHIGARAGAARLGGRRAGPSVWALAAAGLIAGAGCERGPPPAVEADEPRPPDPAAEGGAGARGEPEAGLGGGGGAPREPARLEGTLAEVVAQARKGGGTGRMASSSAEELAAFEGALAAVARAALELALPGAATPPRRAEGGDAPLAPAGVAPAGVDPALLEGLERLGFELGLLVEDGALFYVVREAAGVRRGGGIYVLRGGAGADGADGAEGGDGAGGAGAARPLVIQAPHSFFDAGTGPIALGWFTSARARALCVSTVHRYEGRAARPDSRADVCHNEATAFQAATRGLAAALDGAVFVQVHGYRAANHPDLGEGVLVLSAGSRAGLADPALERAAARLDGLLGEGRALRYDGAAVRSLGGTQNVQGRFLNAYSDDRFYHLELEAALRERLRDEAGLAARFVEALAPLWEPAR